MNITFTILEEKTKDYAGRPFTEYYYSVSGYGDIKYLYGVNGGVSADTVWDYLIDIIFNYDSVDEFVEESFRG